MHYSDNLSGTTGTHTLPLPPLPPSLSMMVVFHTPTLRLNPKSIQSNSFPRLFLPPLHPTGSNVQITRSNPEFISPFQISSSHIEPLDSTWNLFSQVSILLLSLSI